MTNKIDFCTKTGYIRTMLIQFSARNFKSFKDSFSLDLFTNKETSVSSIIETDFARVYSSAVFYGANGSGKSNILKAFNMMRHLVLNKDKAMQSTDHLSINRFKLSSDSEDDTSAFDICFVYNNKKYKYGFEYDSEIVYSEYLFVYETNQPTRVFEYDIDEDDGKIKCTKYRSLSKKKHLKNLLFLWDVDREDIQEAHDVLNWFKETVYIEFSNTRQINPKYWDNLSKPDLKNVFRVFMHDADFGIKDIYQDSQPVTNVMDKIPNLPKDAIVEEITVKTTHEKYDENNNYIKDESFNLFDDESLGTQKYFYVIGPVISALSKGYTLFLDELDASLHPILTRRIVELFNNNEVNKKGAQLIFTSQDTNLLDQTLFDKEQIWFVEKDDYGSSHLIGLSEYKNIRPQEKIEDKYIKGKFGAIPYLGDFKF